MWSSFQRRRFFPIFLIVASLILLCIYISYSSTPFVFEKNSFKIELRPSTTPKLTAATARPSEAQTAPEAQTATGTQATTGTVTQPLTENKSTRICCFILTSPKHHLTRTKAVNETWGPRCDRYFFVSDPPSEKLSKEQAEIAKQLPIAPILDITVGYEYLIQKTKSGFLYAHEHYFNDCQWFLKADDDTYLLVENLRTFLSKQDPTQPVTFGYNFKVIVERGYHSGGASYVISHEALRRFYEISKDPQSPCKKKTGAEDVEFAKCLRTQGVYPGKSLDENNRELFHPLPFTHHLGGIFPDWMYQYAENPLQKGYNCCSDHSISFHYVSPEEMYFMDFLLYKARSPPSSSVTSLKKLSTIAQNMTS